MSRRTAAMEAAWVRMESMSCMGSPGTPAPVAMKNHPWYPTRPPACRPIGDNPSIPGACQRVLASNPAIGSQQRQIHELGPGVLVGAKVDREPPEVQVADALHCGNEAFPVQVAAGSA